MRNSAAEFEFLLNTTRPRQDKSPLTCGGRQSDVFLA